MSTTPAARRRRAPRNPSKPKGERNLASPEATVVSIADLFRKGRSIAQIARDQKIAQDAVRVALSEAGIDYSADKNAAPVGAPKPAAAKEKGEWTLLGSFEAILAKPAPAAGSKRALVVADLASDARTADLQKISLMLAAADSRELLAAMANALNAALSAHYARV